MSEYNLTLCDICAPGKIITLHRGYAFVEPEYALEKLGWVEQEVGHVCSACLKDQEERSARDVAEEAETKNGVAITLEEALLEIDEEEKKLLAPSAYSQYLDRASAVAAGYAALSSADFQAEMKKHIEEKRVSIRKSFGQAPPI